MISAACGKAVFLISSGHTDRMLAWHEHVTHCMITCGYFERARNADELTLNIIIFSPSHSVAECQFSTNLIITFDRNKIQTSNWYHFVSLVKTIRMTYNKGLTDQVMTLIRGIYKFATSLYDLK